VSEQDFDPKDPKQKAELDKIKAQVFELGNKIEDLHRKTEREQNVIAESKELLEKTQKAIDSKLDAVTPGADVQIGGSYVGILTKQAKGSFDAFQLTLMPRNLELIPLYKSAKLDIALFKEPGVQLTVQQQPKDTGSGSDVHTSLGGTVDVFNISSDPKGIEGALTLSAGYDTFSKDVAVTGVLGLKYTLKENASLPFIGRFGTNKVRLYAGVGVEGDIPRATGAPSGFGGLFIGGGLLIESNVFEKKKKD
jgi:hypothetical protein